MQGLTVRPAVLVSGSAIGYYGPSDDTPLTDEPARLVDKQTGRLAFRNPSELPPELRPVT